MKLLTNNCIAYLRPTPKISPAEWIASNVKVGTDGRAYVAGHSPYWREILDDLLNDAVEHIVIVKSAQIGFSLHLACMLFYSSTIGSGDTLYVLPSHDKAKDENAKILGLINKTPSVSSQLVKHTTDKFRWFNSTTYFGSASNSKTLKSITARVVLADEIDEFPTNCEGEGDPIALAEARTIVYTGRGKKIVLGSTPRRDGLILKKYDECSDQRQFLVPCPNCKRYQPLIFSNLKWDDLGDLPHKRKAQIIENSPDMVYYDCPHCHARIGEAQKHAIVNKGVWASLGSQSVNESGEVIGTRPRASKVGYRVNALYSLFMPWHRLAAGFLACLDDPQSKFAWFSQQLGEVPDAGVVQVERFSSSAVLRQQATETGDIVPPNSILIAGADQQGSHVPWVVRAFWVDTDSVPRSQLVAHGVVSKADDLRQVLNRQWRLKGGGEIKINRLAIDLGGTFSNTQNAKKSAFDLARSIPDRVIPVKGIREIRNASQVWTENTEPAYGLRFLSFMGGTIKDRIAWLQQKKQWSINTTCDQSYLNALDAERKVQTDKGDIWTKTATNDYMDCEVYILGLSMYLQLDNLKPQEPPKQFTNEQPEQVPNIIRELTKMLR